MAERENLTAVQAEAAPGPEDALAGGEVSEVLDATVDQALAAPVLSQARVDPSYDPDKYRDATRSYIAYWLLGLLTAVVVFSFGALLFFKKDTLTFIDLKSLLELLLGPIVALVSAATGFYFGSQQQGNGGKKP